MNTVNSVTFVLQPVRIQGVAGTKSLTLDECLRTRRTIEHPGIAREMYYAPIVLAGAHFDEGEPLKFIAATLQFAAFGEMGRGFRRQRRGRLAQAIEWKRATPNNTHTG